MAGSKPNLAEQLLAELGLDRPQVGRWRTKGGAWIRPGRGTSRGSAAEVLVQALVGVDTEELPDAFDGQDLAVGQDRLGSARAEPPVAQPPVDQAVHGDQQRRSIHTGPPYAW
jgi:hypothetical protein